MTWLKQNWISLILMALILVLIFTRKQPTSELKQYQIDQLKAEMKNVLIHEFDSLRKSVQVEIPMPNDSLQQVSVDLNKKIIYELRKKRMDAIDTISSAELRSIFSELARQHPVSAN